LTGHEDRPDIDNVQRLIDAFGAAATHSAVAWKLDVLLDLTREPDPRVVPFLITVVADALQRLRNGRLKPGERARVAAMLVQLLSEGSNTDLCLQSALALGEFVDIPEVVGILGRVVLQPAESFDLRYAAFTSIQRAGPTPEAQHMLRRLTDDDVLGPSAASVLNSWRIS
jgi:hypothetical protein